MHGACGHDVLAYNSRINDTDRPSKRTYPYHSTTVALQHWVRLATQPSYGSPQPSLEAPSPTVDALFCDSARGEEAWGTRVDTVVNLSVVAWTRPCICAGSLGTTRDPETEFQDRSLPVV